ncbi:GyrI-like domain-containing protein [Photobacterium alginatilyticum]|uniref:AraC family transcriptional regulator n=1 Tax=Photobacterium alginatilyticum TaxID=1775171 RepID=A0ABW9YEL2_9GAMM|nr:GyrI-like domain-containing protein [Photobacterium alginatilyticum]NBI52201.1 AraC family transcriptional regulator [Photobacterium alginatilyticum]
MEPRIVELNEIQVTGIQVLASPESGEFGKTWPKLFERYNEIDPLDGLKSWYGVQSYDKELMSQGIWKYTAGTESKAGIKTPIGMETLHLPKSKYAVFEYHGAISPKLGETFGYIYREWLPNSEYNPAGMFDFERYDERFLGPEHPDSILEIYVPIIEK